MIRDAWRLLCRRPIAALGVILSLSFAIGVNTAVVGLADQAFLRPLPVQQPEQLVSVYGLDPASGTYYGTAYRTFLDYRDRTRDVVSGLAAFGRIPLDTREPGGTRLASIVVEEVTGDYFDVLKIAPMAGRVLAAADDHAGAMPVVVIGERLWRARFNRDPEIIGRSLPLGGRAFTIVGVLPDAFHGVLLDWNGEPDAWIPLAQLPSAFDAATATRLIEDPQIDWMMVVGRLQPEVTRERAEAAFRLAANTRPGAASTGPAASAGLATSAARAATAAAIRLAVFPTNRTKFWPGARESVEGRLTILIAGAALLLLLACVNVTTLLIERGLERQHELSLRLALGAGRWRLIRLLLSESALLAIASLAGALLVARFTTDVIVQYRGGLGHSLNLASQLDARTFIICAGVTLLVMIACSVGPLLWSLRTDALGALRTTPRVVGSSKRATLARNGLVAVQVCMAMIVLMSAGAFIDSLQRAGRVRPGFDPDRLVFVQADFSLQRYRPDAAMRLAERVIASLEADGVVANATVSSKPALATSRTPVTIARDAGTAASNSASTFTAESDSIAANYFDVLNIPLLAGRAFDARDRREAPRVAVINQALARALWPDASDASTIGRRIWLHRGNARPAAADADAVAIEIVGVAANTRYAALWEERPRLFFPIRQTDVFPTALILHTRGALPETAAAIDAAITSADPQLPLPKIQSWPQSLDGALVQQRLGLTLFTTFSAAMLLLTIVGLYSVTASRVTQRRHEIAIRIALGATPHSVRRSILVHSAAITAAGLTPGILLGLTATTLVAGILPGLEPATTSITASLGALLLALTIVATLSPARRAASTDPMRVLKD
jgi:putative ABC transport system permease protein